MPSFRGEVPVMHPAYPDGSAAAAKAVDNEDIATVCTRFERKGVVGV